MSDLGNAIRSIRHREGLTLKELAGSTGFSHSYISQVERGVVTPSLSALRELASALGVSPGDLVDGDQRLHGQGIEPVRIVRRENRISIQYPTSNVKNELLLPEYDPEWSVSWISFPPHSRSPQSVIQHHQVSFLTCVVVSGALVFHMGGEELRLERGDAITFDIHADHGWTNEDSCSAEMILITHPRFESPGIATQGRKRRGSRWS